MKIKASKRFRKLIEISKNKQIETIEEAIKKVKKNCTSKFNESIDVSFALNLKNKKEEANLRTIVNLPNGNGKKIKIAVLCEESKIKDATSSGADFTNSDNLIKNITDGKINFDKLIATPSMMSKMGKLGKILGPKGLMPNPKLGSVTNDLKQAVTDAKSGQVEIKNDKDGNIGLSLGKKSFSDDKLLKNFNAVFETLEREKGNNTLKGDLIKNVFLTSTMGVSYKIKLTKNI